MNSISGVINVYKEKGYTSHDVVAKLRGILKTKKIGHTGTLDPEAEGVLPVCIGSATKLCELIMGKHKTYEAELILGIATDTEDMTGNVIKKYDGTINIDRQVLDNVIESFVGEYMQIPPMYSAIKVNGKRLYDMARDGIEIERSPRKVHIFSIEVLNVQFPVVKIRVSCGKGTYIRALCRDIGESLGVYGCMGYLLRTKTGMFQLKDSHKLDEIQDIFSKGELQDSGILIPADKLLCDYPKLYISERYVKLLNNGNPLPYEAFVDNGNIKEEHSLYRIYYREKFVAIYRKNENDLVLKPEKMFL